METLEELIGRAKKNEEIARNLFDIEVSILNIASTQVFLEHLLSSVLEKFDIRFGWYSIIETPITQPLIKSLKQSEQLAQAYTVLSSVEYLEATKGKRQPLLDHRNLQRFKLMTPSNLRGEVKSIAVLPLLLDGRLAGSLNLADSCIERYKADKEVFFLQQLSIKASLCLSAVVSREKVAYLATRDPLTKLRNRRELEDTLERELSRVLRHGQPLGLAFIDCDDFKQVNDSYGHDIGDEYLKHVANLLQELLRKTDLVFRFAGDEFVALLPNQDEAGAKQIAERMRDHLHSRPLIYENIQIPVKISVGTASTSNLPNISAKVLLKQADNRLYEKKQLKNFEKSNALEGLSNSTFTFEDC